MYRGHAYGVFGDVSSSFITLIREGDAPVPEGLAPDPEEPDRAFYVEPRELDSWYSSRWTFRWRNEPFSSMGSDGETIAGRYTGDDQRFAERYCRREDKYDYWGSFPLANITELTEHRTDLLAKWKAKHGG